MEPIAFVTGADRGLGQALCAGLLERGWRVFAGQYMPEWLDLGALAERSAGRLTLVPLDVGDTDSAHAAVAIVAEQVDHVDVLINNAGIIGGQDDIRVGMDYAGAARAYNINSLGPLRVTESLLSLLERGERKRLCFVSSEAGSVTLGQRKSMYGYCMSKTALNMAVRIMFNDLRPKGFTFRLYHPGWMRSYMGGQKSTTGTLEPEEAAVFALDYFLSERDDEGRLALTDYRGHEWPF